MGESPTHLHSAQQRLTQELGREPTEQDLADALEVPISRLRLNRRAALHAGSVDQPVGVRSI